MMKYKGYMGRVAFDDDAGVFHGEVVNTRDVITFQGETVAEARRAFEDSVDDYLEFCAARGEAPEKPFSGRFVVRLDPAVHRALAIEAEARGISLNALVEQTLTTAVQGHIPEGEVPATPKGPGRVRAGPTGAKA